MKLIKGLFDTRGKRIFMGLIAFGVIASMLQPSSDEIAQRQADAEAQRQALPFDAVWAQELERLKHANCGSSGTTISPDYAQIKAGLRDPDSFQLIGTTVTGNKTKKTARKTIAYRAKNGFGGYVSDVAHCEWTWDAKARRFK